MDRAPLLVRVLGVAVVGVAMVALVFSAVTTSQGRIAASTENTASFFEAATIDLQLGIGGSSSEQLFFDADGLYPGAAVEGCVTVVYEGSVDAEIRLYGRQEGGSGLDRYLITRLEVGTAIGADCEGFAPARTVYAGSLDAFWQRHPSYAEGVVIAPVLAGRSTLTIRAAAEVQDANAAQGLTSSFWMVLEARP